MPRHWKGFGVSAAVILPTVAAILVVQAALDGFGYRTPDRLPFPIFFTPRQVVPSWRSKLA